MVDRIYQCNFCRETYKPDDHRLIGVNWQGVGGGSEFVAADVRKVENHICLRCIRCIVQIANTTLKGRL